MRVAAVAHVFHRHLWPEMAQRLRNIPEPFTLFVSVPPDGGDPKEIRADFPDVHIRRVRNIGRDIAPFLEVLRALQPFDVVCKLHTKTDDGWRRFTYDCLLANPDLVAQTIHAFAMFPDIAIVGPDVFWLDGPNHVGKNAERLNRWLGPSLPERYSFFAGTMMWLRPSCFAKLPEMIERKFVAHNDSDGHPEHAIERLFGIVPVQQHARIGLVDHGDPPRLRIVSADAQGHPDYGTLLKALGRL